MKLRFAIKFFLALNGIAFALLLSSFLVALFFFGVPEAEVVWEPIGYLIAWAIAVPVAIKWFKDTPN